MILLVLLDTLQIIFCSVINCADAFIQSLALGSKLASKTSALFFLAAQLGINPHYSPAASNPMGSWAFCLQYHRQQLFLAWMTASQCVF